MAVRRRLALVFGSNFPPAHHVDPQYVGTVNPGIDGAVTCKAIIIKLLQPTKDLLILKVKGREDVFPQSGDPCDIKIENATVTATIEDHEAAFHEMYRTLRRSLLEADTLEHFNDNCFQLLRRPLEDSEFEISSR
ncbi:hypothetical protein FIE12Z_11419 [Fusarium flagelliforme]|uniref:Uncharacterized protein n=1 Tax=Fusarium flagelliforme TaxID=2675880 RepID=A0A395M8Y1_9HYPO|nr:hypothetical protein FIE12Z_11419 [Fusarium flagelliforme]